MLDSGPGVRGGVERPFLRRRRHRLRFLWARHNSVSGGSTLSFRSSVVLHIVPNFVLSQTPVPRNLTMANWGVRGMDG